MYIPTLAYILKKQKRKQFYLNKLLISAFSCPLSSGFINKIIFLHTMYMYKGHHTTSFEYNGKGTVCWPLSYRYST